MNLSDYIDHTNLSKTATAEDIMKLCEEAKTYHFPTVCIPPYYVKVSTPGNANYNGVTLCAKAIEIY